MQLNSDQFRGLVADYFKNKGNHPLYDFWISDHLKKVGIPDSGLHEYLHGVVKHIENERLPRGRRLLDLGCGMGEFSVFLGLQGYQVTGIDMDAEQLRIACKLSQENDNIVTFLMGDAANLPFRDEYFDLVICFDVFEHIGELRPTLNELYRVCNDQSGIFARFPNKLKLIDDHTGLPFLPLLPGDFQRFYMKLFPGRGAYYQECSGVHYRYFQHFLRMARRAGFHVEPIPPHLAYPRSSGLIRLAAKCFPRLAPSIEPYFHLLLLKKSSHTLQPSFLIEILERLFPILAVMSPIPSIARAILRRVRSCLK